MSCYVYVAAVVQNGRPRAPVKVGISSNPWSRVHEMQTGSPLRLTVLHALWFPDRGSALAYEREFHRYSSEDRLHGEWFNIEPWEALNALVECIDIDLWRRFSDVPLFLHLARERTGILKAAHIIGNLAEQDE